MNDFFYWIFFGILFGLVASPVVAGLLWVFSITISIINFNWIFVGAISFMIGFIIAIKILPPE